MFKGRKNIYFAGMFIAFYYTLTIYINSTLLSNIASSSTVSLLYTFSSIISLIILIFAPKILKSGLLKTFVVVACIQIAATFSLGTNIAPMYLLSFFVIHQALGPILYYMLDIFLEHEIKSESETGASRGAYLTFQNIAWVSSPVLVSIISPLGNFDMVYMGASLLILPALFLIARFYKRYRKIHPENFAIKKTLKSALHKGDIRRILISNTILEFFYATMVIYLPLLLILKNGFVWAEIGIILTIMLLPFLLFEYPIGYLEDKKVGEREILGAGIIITAVATYFVGSSTDSSIYYWALLLFVSRIGASMIEISNQSYFFKHVDEEDSGLISLFRITRPVAYIAAPLIAIPILNYGGYSSIFTILSFITISGLFFIPIKDTK